MLYFLNVVRSVFRTKIIRKMSSNVDLTKDIRNFKFSPCKFAELPFDPVPQNYVRPMVRGAIFSRVNPTPLTNPRLVSVSDDVLQNVLDLDPRVSKTKDFVDFIAGNLILESSTPFAHRYGGHQFGVWASQLGDGRAIVLGQYINNKGETWELQLKGSGLTPYSRGADGRAVLRSSIREFLCSEAMYHLGIPTSRAGAIIVSDDQVIRDLLYDGHPKLEPTAVVLRLAPSWFRIGSLEILSKFKEIELLKKLLDFIIKEYFHVEGDDKYLEFLKIVCRRSSDLVIAWQAVGFTHGVLNTDNISLEGITIDYGPFGFMESYDLLFTPNHSDSSSRYCYGRQIQIMIYNLLMLASALSPILTETQRSEAVKIVKNQEEYIEAKMFETFSKKLALDSSSPDLVKLLLKMMIESKLDFTMTFREMSENTILKPFPNTTWTVPKLSKHNLYPKFIEIYKELLSLEGKTEEQRMKIMQKINPCYVLRNWMAEDAIKEANSGNFVEVDRLLRVLKNPFTRQEEADKKGFAARPPDWSKSLCLSCSS